MSHDAQTDYCGDWTTPRRRCVRSRHVIVVLVALMISMDVRPEPAVAQRPEAASSDALWTALPVARVAAERNAQIAAPAKGFRPTNFRLFWLDPNVLTNTLRRAPLDARVDAARMPALSEITLPMPDGSFQKFRVVESPVMPPALAAKFPNIKTYRGQSLDDPTASARFDTSPRGLHAQILSAAGTIIIDPFGGENQHASFNKRSNRAASRPFQCLVQGRPALDARAQEQPAARSGQYLRTYRLAVACTGEYAAHFGGTVPDAMSAIVTTVNRVNGIYEREAAIRLVLVDNNDELIFTDPHTDPFTNNDAHELIAESQAEIDARIGDANYDIGHTLSTGAGGLAGLGVACRSGHKASGVTGRSDPSGDPFDVDYVAHEMGHQFDGDHTFNGVFGSCSGGNRNGPTAYEPGSGSTIQAYAGICNSDDLQANSDPYFHSISLEQIIAYTTTGAGNRPTPVPSGNNSPTVDGGPDFAIPAQTPFTLTADGIDPDGDGMTFCWEQRDLGPPARVDAPDDGRIPLFRSVNPTPDPSRTFPKWSSILSQTTALGEQLPTKSRNLHFRVTVRDNRSGGGGVDGDDVVLQVVQSAGPFKVTTPTTAVLDSDLLTVTWDVANTDQAPINVQFVNILLSTDGGQTFSVSLASGTENDGEELVALPETAGSSLRIMIQSVDNVFFAVSPMDFRVRAPQQSIFVVRHAEKGPGANPDLTEAGQRRAAVLALLLSARRIHAVYSTDTNRTRQTAEPTATSAGVSVQEYSDVTELATELRARQQGERVLVVAHSNTAGPILNALGVNQQVQIGENDFDNLFVANLRDSTAAFQHFRYGNRPVGIAARPETAVRSNTASGVARRLGVLEEKIDRILEKLDR